MKEEMHREVLEFLQNNHLGVLGTVDQKGKPWGSAIYFVTDKDFKFYFVTRMETFKFKNIEGKPFVSLTVVNEKDQTTVQAQGEISKLPAKDYMDIVFNKLVAIRPKGDYNWAPPIEKIHAGDYIPLVLNPTRLHYANFKKRQTDPDQKYIFEII